MKNTLCIVGASLIIGGVATAIYLLRKKEYNENPECKDSEKTQSPVEDMSLSETVPTQETSIYEDIKSSAIGSMYSRHEDATTIMRDSVEAIRENVKISTDTNNEIDEVSAELDEMLSED